MCYPCSGCNGCGKMNSELFSYMIPQLRCMNCGAEYSLGEGRCATCGGELPMPPGEREWQREGTIKAPIGSIRRC
jgi:hypothetical protein